MIEALDHFHFLRPVWLVLIPVIIGLWFWIRSQPKYQNSSQASSIASHLQAALQVGGAAQQRLRPIDGVLLAAGLLVLAVAGPTWSREPNPLLANSAPLVVALKVTDSMLNTDLTPSRLDRARFKLQDLITQRAGARTAVIAYAGSAHRVSPLTEDANILRPLLDGLSPDIMPVAGNDAGAALVLAQDVLSTADTPGAILFLLDDFDPSDLAAFEQDNDRPRPPVIFLVTAPDSVSLPQLNRVSNADVIRLTADDADMAHIKRRLRAVYIAALAGDERLRWQDRGWLFAWPVAALALIWFRRGWTMRWVMVAAVVLAGFSPRAARADGWMDWFLTPDQQGQRAYDDLEFAKAGELFADPYWRGYAKSRAGQYDEAAQVFTKIDSPEAALAEGMALIRNRQYRPAIAAFETALKRRPDYPEAQNNLEVARAVLEFVETTREQSDTGEDTGIGADDVVFDNEATRGADSSIVVPKEDAAPLTGDQWMSAIDTDMGDFLRSRFLLEHSEAQR
ncbi:VWA domain-containing protein [Sedimentitalea sp. CY04]|uniref:VWA domain-containing protein n=1 Tax=Parasedimentitalea denitrificans TaxID=2211118 RepID=A0ABX0WBP0_9RHOB|nr:VWA domain-containing protein [Sedimentitalea sp. CY04]NIZ63037.1 VWA domain-containing protein [Sedimentitalea sp. CY04]